MMPWMERVLWGSLLLGLLFAIPLFLQAADALPGGNSVVAGGEMNPDARPLIAGNISPAVGARAASGAASAMGGGSIR